MGEADDQELDLTREAKQQSIVPKSEEEDKADNDSPGTSSESSSSTTTSDSNAENGISGPYANHTRDPYSAAPGSEGESRNNALERATAMERVMGGLAAIPSIALSAEGCSVEA